MDCTVTCLGKEGTTFNMVVFNDPYLFKGGSFRTLHESVGKVLEKVHDDFGKKLFKVEYLELVKEPAINVDNEITLEPDVKEISDAVEIEVIPSIIIDDRKVTKKNKVSK